MRPAPSSPFHHHRQRGAALLVMITLIGLGASYILVSSLARIRPELDRQHATTAALNEARDILLGWLAGHGNAPGLLLFPDRNADGDYDGFADCPPNGSPYPHPNSALLGRLPWQGEAVPCENATGGIQFQSPDGAGERLWYAVSGNLVDNTSPGFPAITTSILTVSNGWLTVRDQSGTVLSNRVAFLLLAPGAALSGQNRAPAAPAPANYLDTLVIAANTYRNWDNDLDFVAAPQVDDPANQFNDRLIFATREEVANRLAARVAGEIRLRLDQYRATNGAYPYAAPTALGDCEEGLGAGNLPLQDVAAPPCSGGALNAFPGWFNAWQGLTGYQRLSGDQIRFSFAACASQFTVTWNGAGSGSLDRSGPC